MKILGKHIEKDKSGVIRLLPEEEEDMWHIYNIIQDGDSIRASTIRKVTTETATGSTQSKTVHITLTVVVENIEFDTQGATIHVKGKNIEENAHVKLGAYHTLDLAVNRKFSVRKHRWDSIQLDRVQAAADPRESADVLAVVMQEGLAHICLVTANMTLVRQKIDVSIPRKRKGHMGQYEKGLARFFDQVMQALLKHANFPVLKCILIASPGFVKDQFHEYIFKKAAAEGNKTLLENKSKILLVHSSSGFKHSLKEVLQDPSVASKLSETKAAAEVKALEDFYTMLQTEPDKAFYGIDHVERANGANAIETLMVSDDLFRSKDLQRRERYVKLVESCKEQQCKVHIFSTLHVSGEQLAQLSGVAAILRFPMPEIEDEEHENGQEEHLLDEAAGGQK